MTSRSRIEVTVNYTIQEKSRGGTGQHALKRPLCHHSPSDRVISLPVEASLSPQVLELGQGFSLVNQPFSRVPKQGQVLNHACAPGEQAVTVLF